MLSQTLSILLLKSSHWQTSRSQLTIMPRRNPNLRLMVNPRKWLIHVDTKRLFQRTMVQRTIKSNQLIPWRWGLQLCLWMYLRQRRPTQCLASMDCSSSTENVMRIVGTRIQDFAHGKVSLVDKRNPKSSTQQLKRMRENRMMKDRRKLTMSNGVEVVGNENLSIPPIPTSRLGQKLPHWNSSNLHGIA